MQNLEAKGVSQPFRCAGAIVYRLWVDNALSFRACLCAASRPMFRLVKLPPLLSVYRALLNSHYAPLADNLLQRADGFCPWRGFREGGRGGNPRSQELELGAPVLIHGDPGRPPSRRARAHRRGPQDKPVEV